MVRSGVPVRVSNYIFLFSSNSSLVFWIIELKPGPVIALEMSIVANVKFNGHPGDGPTYWFWTWYVISKIVQIPALNLIYSMSAWKVPSESQRVVSRNSFWKLQVKYLKMQGSHLNPIRILVSGIMESYCLLNVNCLIAQSKIRE